MFNKYLLKIVFKTLFALWKKQWAYGNSWITKRFRYSFYIQQTIQMDNVFLVLLPFSSPSWFSALICTNSKSECLLASCLTSFSSLRNRKLDSSVISIKTICPLHWMDVRRKNFFRLSYCFSCLSITTVLDRAFILKGSSLRSKGSRSFQCEQD